MEQGIRGAEEAVYRADRAEIARLFAEREGAGTASTRKVVVGSKQLVGESCIILPPKDAGTTASAEGLEAAEAAEGKNEDVEIGEDQETDSSADDGSSTGISFHFEAASGIEENVDTDDMSVDLSKEVGMVGEGAEEISGMELRRRIRQRVVELLAMLDELAVADELKGGCVGREKSMGYR